jgi:hypothetical protein
MPALLATLHDLLVGLGIGTVIALATVATIKLTTWWLKRVNEPILARLPREPESPVDFDREIRQHQSLQRGRGRRAA